MNATTNDARLGFSQIAEAAASTDAERLAQYSWLNEVPGLVFGLVTLFYIVSSLIALA